MTPLEEIGQMLKAKREAEVSDAVRIAALSILEELEPDFDSREVAHAISEAVWKILHPTAE